MTRCHVPRWSLRSWLVACLVLTVWMGTPRLLAAALVTPEEMNSVRVYKQLANATVLSPRPMSARITSHRHREKDSGQVC